MTQKFSFWFTLSLWGISLVIATIALTKGTSSRQLSSSVLTGRIAIVEIFGPIVYESENTTLPGIRQGGVLSWIEELEEAANDPTTAAVVLRINSPGGTIGATQELHAAIKRLREKGKVVVASFGDIAASGGYYIATACHAIVSLPGTLTGSIGVIIQGYQYDELMRKLGIKATVFKSGSNKDILAGYREMTTEEKAILTTLVKNTYEQFLQAIVEGRDISRNELLPLADGRIFTGEQALRVKLVDKLGSFYDAIALAKDMAKLPASAPIYYTSEEKLTLRRLLRRLSFHSPNILPNNLSEFTQTKLWYYSSF
ncbi:signal peptide peptidase SppA [Thermospira aquatica]|uniref:Signal peptide peptidase SppA n=1 Tax=Thermospira aquatica TaxID=2828656 RepID=A0AAX3BDW5_9SPIR|nr:signal peptide peptidase SppA [Thermospira aquatica]URA10512.1 signal peptide peptidase SppA [Thermospira aquatica]